MSITQLLTRVLKPGMKGGDVYVCKRALRSWAAQTGHPKRIETPVRTSVWGDAVTNAVADFHSAHAIQREHDEIGPITFPLLAPYVDAWGVVLLKLYIRRHPAPVILSPRQRIAEQLDDLCDLHSYIDWGEVRPIPLARIRDHQITATWRLTTDCSGSGTGACFAAHAPDPNGLGYSGQGWTGTLLSHLQAIPPSQLKLCDPIIFGTWPGAHVVWVRHPNPTDLAQTTVFSLGHNGGDPDEPALYPLQVFFDYFSGRPVTYLSLGI